MVVRADGTQLHSLLPGASRGTCNRDGNFDLYAVSATGTKILQLTRTDAPVQNDADGTGLMPATYDVGTETQPAFSPDGRQLAYVSDATGATELFTTRTPPMPFVTPPTRITFDGASKANPSRQPSTSRAVR